MKEQEEKRKHEKEEQEEKRKHEKEEQEDKRKKEKAKREREEQEQEEKRIKQKIKREREEEEQENLAQELAKLDREHKLAQAKAKSVLVHVDDHSKAASKSTTHGSAGAGMTETKHNESKSIDLPATKSYAAFISHKKTHSKHVSNITPHLTPYPLSLSPGRFKRDARHQA
jgi:hypothetical protein